MTSAPKDGPDVVVLDPDGNSLSLAEAPQE